MDGIFKSTETINLSSLGVTELEGSQLKSPNNSFSSISSNPSRSRYGRTCKPKTSTDYCNIDEIFEGAKIKKQTSPKRTKVVSKIVSDSANSVKNSRSKSKTNKKSFMHVTGDSDFKISVNNVKCSRSPNKVNKKYKTEKVKLDNLKITKDDQTIKKSIQTETVCESETEQLDENLSDNVSKALKIVSSQPSFTENDVSPDQKSNKLTLKTYSNKRKFTPKKQVVESFGLPDLPIFPVEEKPLEVKEDFKFEEETKEDQEMTVVNKICTKSSQDEGKVNKEIEIIEEQKNENLIQKLEDETDSIPSPKLPFSGDKDNSSNQSDECEKSQEDECGMNEKITQEVNVTYSEQESAFVSNDTIKSIKLPDNSPKTNVNLPDSEQESQSSFQEMKLEDFYNIESKRRLIVELSNDLNLSVALNKGKLNLKKESPNKLQKSPMKKLKSEISKSPVTLRKSTRRNTPNSQTPKAENQDAPSLLKVTEDKLNHNEKIDKENEIVQESSIVISSKVLRSSKQFKTDDNIKSEVSSEDSKIQNLKVENNVTATEVLYSEISNEKSSSEEQETKGTKTTVINNLKPDSEAAPKEEIGVAKSSLPKEKDIEEKTPISFPQLRRSPIKRLPTQTDSSSKVNRSPSPNKLPLVIENDYLQEIEKYSSLYCAHKKQKVKKRSAPKKLGTSDKINNVKPIPNKKLKSFLQGPEIQQVIDVKNLPDNESKKDNVENKEKKKIPLNTTPSVDNSTSKKEKKRTLRSSANFIHTSPENEIIKTEIVKVAVKKSKDNFPQSSSQDQPVEPVNEDTSESLPNEDRVEEKQTSEENNFKIGDLIWSRVGSYPYWPSMVCAEPDLECFKKTFVSRTAQLFYHVKFFGDKGRRSWINHKNIIPYHNRDDLEVLLKRDKSKPENKYSAQRTKLYQIYKAAKYILPKWKRAVDEIDSLKPKTVRERLQFFEEVALRFAKPKTKIKKKEQDKKTNSFSDENKNEKPKNVEENDEIKLKELVQEKVKNSEEKNQNELVQVSHKKDEENKELEQKKLKKNDEKKGEELVQESGLDDGHFSRKLRKRVSEKVTPSKTPPNNNDSPTNRMLRSQASTAEETITKTEVTKREKDSKSCKYNVTESISFNNFVNKNIKSFKENKPELDDKNVEKNLKELWNNLSVREKRVYGFISDLTSEYSDSDTHSSSKGSTFSAIPNSMEEQIKLYKRNRLFKGVNRQRVCNNCEKPNGVFKCKGPCNGSYHPECTQVPIADVKQEIEIKTENLEENSESILEKDQQIVSSSLHSEKTEPVPETTTDPNPQETKNEETYDPNKQIKVEKDDECFIDQSNSLNFHNVSIDDSRVEIISVYSDDSDVELSEVTKLDTSSRKLSLFEQIDLKMKEVMSKRGDKTTYADSTTDFSSENSTTESEETPKPIEKNDDPVEIQKNPDVIPFDQENFKCSYCSREIDPPCFVCGLETSVKNVSRRIKCSLYKCGKFYHVDCLKIWPQTQWSLINSSKSKKEIDKQFDSFVCPCHVCHTCVSDDPRVAISRCSSDKVVKCLRCPATYHTSNLCVPAGTSILSSSQILCPRHRTRTRNSNKLPRNSQTINTTWCFICSQGGNLICCETCPTSVHPDCLKVNLMDDGTFVCEDCESGRFPLYDEIVWAKLGSFRWWPAIILFPNEVPDNVANLPHRQGEFVVRFFGSHDHYWVNSGRVFLFQEEDQGGRSHLKRKIDQLFNKSIDEAVAAYRLKKKFKSQKESEVKDGLKPPPYIKIKANKPVGSVKMSDGNTSNTTACECDPKEPFPCGPDTDCINRLLMTECNPDICPAGDRCYNQRFEKRQYAPLEPYRTESRGWGLRSLAPIRRGDFVIEYVGELIDDREYQRRMNRMHETKDENYYFLTVDKDRIIDAGPKGNLARFMNHSCQPNCETQKWTVNGDTKVGLFALDDIPTKTELTFNYNLECVGKEKKVCKCGAETCSGFIGGKSKENAKKLKKKDSLTRRKTAPSPTPLPANENACFVCGEMGEVRGCCYKVCNKFYHLKCVSLQYWPEGNKWFCPSHNCNTCGKRTIRCCYKCINSYCPSHAEGNVRYDNMLGFVCSDHDPAKASQEPLQKYPPKKKSRMAATKETDITSTTEDILDSTSTTTTTKENHDQTNCEETLNEDLLKEYEDVNSAKSTENFVGFDRATSTPLKTLKSTTVDAEENKSEEEEQKADKSSSKSNTKKRKRGKLRKEFRGNKRIKLEENDASKRNLNVPQLLNNVSVQNEVKLSSTVPERHLRTVRNSLNSSTSDRFFKHQSDLEKDLPIRKRTRLRCEVNADEK